MKVANLIVWDLETGGLDYKVNPIVEIAMIAIDSVTLEEIGRYEAIIAPYNLENNVPAIYDQRALAYNGMTMEKINKGKEAKQVANEIIDFCKSVTKPIKFGAGLPIAVGHNIVSFDIPFLTYFLKLFKKEYSTIFQPMSIDTLLWSRMKWSEDDSIQNHKLETACSEVGIELIDGHRAMNDVEANAKLVVNFLNNLRSTSSTTEEVVVTKRYRDTFNFSV